jgi:hypothetical protein
MGVKAPEPFLELKGPGTPPRASLCASAICAGVMSAVALSRFSGATLSPLAAAKLYHMCAMTWSRGTLWPLSYMTPRML